MLSLYERETHAIVFNIDVLESLGELDIVASLIHESRHAYQWYQITHPKEADENVVTRSIWQQEFETYQKPLAHGLDERFLRQAIEIDAIAFTKIEIDRIGEARLAIPKEIEEDVYLRIREIQAGKE